MEIFALTTIKILKKFCNKLAIFHKLQKINASFFVGKDNDAM